MYGFFKNKRIVLYDTLIQQVLFQYTHGYLQMLVILLSVNLRSILVFITKIC